VEACRPREQHALATDRDEVELPGAAANRAQQLKHRIRMSARAVQQRLHQERLDVAQEALGGQLVRSATPGEQVLEQSIEPFVGARGPSRPTAIMLA
jgi:hypothetical protein